jgi:hypothetical protein
VLQPISTHQYHSRKDLAARAHGMISAAYHERPTGRQAGAKPFRNHR